MNHLDGLKDCLPSEIVPTPFDSRPLDEVHRPAEYPGQLLFHVSKIDEGMTGLRVETDKHIYVAVLSKVLAQHGSEEC